MTKQTLPDWFVSDIPPETSIRSSRKRVGYVRKGLSHLGEVLARDLSTPVCAHSWLGRMEPRAKLLSVCMLVIASTFLHTLWALLTILAVILAVSFSIGLPIRNLGRIWLGVPLFSLALILPAATNLVTHGEPIMVLWHFNHTVLIGSWMMPNPVAVTDAGFMVASRFLLRTLDCVTLCYLLIASTDSMLLLNGLRRLGMPKVFGMVLTMCQRYLAVIIKSAEEIHVAKISRTITTGPIRSEQRWVAAGMGMLFRRTHKLAQEVQNSMISRGYDGDLQVQAYTRTSFSDVLLFVVCTAGTVALVITDHMLMRS